MKVACVVLAGGEGRRMGGGKPQRLLGETTLLDRAVAKARVWSGMVAVAIRQPGQLVPPETACIKDVPDVEGPLGGLFAALSFAAEQGAEAVLTIPADMPFLPADLRRRLEASLSGSAAAIASSGGQLHPVCGMWSTKCTLHLPKYLASGKRSLRGFADAVGAAAVEWGVEPTDPFFNINTPDDLAAAERKLLT